jgi:phosphoribosylglycinamide formyltransferase-1
MLKLAVLISGRGSNLGAIINAIERGELAAEICGVISDNPEAKGLELARNHGVKSFVVERKRSERTLQEFFRELTDTVVGLSPDLVVLAGFMRIVPTEMVEKFEGRMINIHPSLLPAFKGLHAQRQALEAGVKFAGCTVHYVVPEVDAGEIIAQAVVPVLPDDTEESLSARILVEEHKLLPAVIKEIASKYEN